VARALADKAVIAQRLLPRVPESRPFKRYLASRVFTLCASAMTPVLLMMSVVKRTGSVVDLGLVLGVSVVPGVALLLVSSLIVRRLAKSRIIGVGAVANAAVFVAYPYTTRLVVPRRSSLNVGHAAERFAS